MLSGLLVALLVAPSAASASESTALAASQSPPAATAASHAAPTKAAARWLPPLGAPLRLTAPFKPPPTPYAAGHRGIDLPATAGVEVKAPAAGVVSFVGKVVDREVLSVRVDAHTVVSLEPIDAKAASLKKGDTVGRGDNLGTVSAGGHCGNSCLHLGVRVDDEYVNPMRYFLGKPVLLPW